jgi:transmembrane sensor
MSMAASEPVFETDAGVIEAQAARWLERRNFGLWDEGVQAELDAWINESSAHEVAFLRLEAAWRRTERLAALRASDSDAAKIGSRFRLLPAVVGIAASLAILTAVGLTAGKFFLPHAQVRTYTTPVGGHEVVSFSDGTEIELNTNTVLRASMTTDQRTVWLDKGEAYFQVKHDAAHPFTVFVGDHRITDLGTKFLIRRDTGRLEVAVEQGRVAFKTSDQKAPLQSALLSRGDAVVATATSTVMSKVSPAELANELTWRRGVLVFKHERLADAAAEFNRYNRIKLIVTDPVAANRLIGATFPINDVDRFARVARDVLGLQVVYGDNKIVIQR